MTMTQNRLSLLISLFLMTVANISFWGNTMEIYPPVAENIGFLISLFILLVSLNTFLLALFGFRYTLKPLLILVLIVSSFTAYFMDSYHIVIDTGMIRNTLQTNLSESLDLLSLKMLGYFLFLGLLPSVVVYKVQLTPQKLSTALLAKTIRLITSALLIAGSMYLYSKHYTSFVREHQPLRYSVNPDYWIYSIVKYVKKNYFNDPIVLQPVGRDAKIPENIKPKLIIMVVGEATRANHWGLNGYTPDTTPQLGTQDIVNFPTLYSCDTATAQSVPCMFSKFGREDFDYRKGVGYENALDILNHTGKVSLLWRDNNSDSKGVALRIPYEDYRTSRHNTICEGGECRDEGMLIGLDRYIADQNGSHILITLHQMGNHGPAYYKRYPKQYAQFTPVCTTNQLEKCTQQEISHAYDNAVLHTDGFLTETIALLKQYQNSYDVGLIYMADHGESLGENGVYLHGMPYFMAPDAQKHVAGVMWFANQNRTRLLKQRADQPYSHDHLFHTLLGLFGVVTTVYNPALDILHEIP